MLSIDSFPKIDAHIHFNADRKNIIEIGSKYKFSLITINTEVPEFPSINRQRDLAKKYRATSLIDLSYASTIPTNNIFQDNWANNAINKIKKDVSEGACGIKFWKNIGMSIQRDDESFLMLDDPELKPIFDFLETEQIPVLGHQGEPKNCWLPIEQMTVKSDREYFAKHPQYHMYLHNEYPGYWQHIKARDRVLERHPKLNFVGLHLASMEWDLNEIADRLDKYPNLAVDLAERISHLYYHASKDRNRVIDFFKEYQDRIIYGTDIIDDPESNPSKINKELKQRWEKHWLFLSTDKMLNSIQIDKTFQGLALPRSILEKIYRENAKRWYHI